jgi:hypothetical protein
VNIKINKKIIILLIILLSMGLLFFIYQVNLSDKETKKLRIVRRKKEIN